MVETPFFLVYGRDSNLFLHQLLEPMQYFLGDPESGTVNFETHQLTLAILKKTLDKNHFKNAQKTTFPTKRQPGKWDLKWRPRYRILHIKHDRHYLYTENQATGKTRSCNIKDIVHERPIEFWNIDSQFVRARKYINHPTNLPIITLSN